MKNESEKNLLSKRAPFALLVEEVLHVPVGDHDGLLEVMEHRCEDGGMLFCERDGKKTEDDERSMAPKKTLLSHLSSLSTRSVTASFPLSLSPGLRCSLRIRRTSEAEGPV